VSQAIDVLVDDRTVLANRDAARHAAHVRMRGMHAAVDHGDEDAFAGELS